MHGVAAPKVPTTIYHRSVEGEWKNPIGQTKSHGLNTKRNCLSIYVHQTQLLGAIKAPTLVRSASFHVFIEPCKSFLYVGQIFFVKISRKFPSRDQLTIVNICCSDRTAIYHLNSSAQLGPNPGHNLARPRWSCTIPVYSVSGGVSGCSGNPAPLRAASTIALPVIPGNSKPSPSSLITRWIAAAKLLRETS